MLRYMTEIARIAIAGGGAARLRAFSVSVEY